MSIPRTEGAHASKLVSSFRGRTVLVVGDLMLDRYWWGTVNRISPEAPVPVVHVQRSSVALGGAANVASNVAALGGEPLLVGMIGRDAAGQEFRAALEERGLGAENLVADSDRATTVKTRIVAHNQHVVRVDEEDTRPLPPALVGHVAERISSLLPSCDIVIVSDYAKGLLAPDLLREIMIGADRLGRQVVVDPKGLNYSRYNGATLLAPNRIEALIAAGFLPAQTEHTPLAASRLLESLHAEAVLVTEGAAGMTLYERGVEPRHVPAVARAVYDVTGAGDTVVATLGLALAAGADLWTATQMANLAAGIAVEQIGTAAVSAEQLSKVVSDGRQREP